MKTEQKKEEQIAQKPPAKIAGPKTIIVNDLAILDKLQAENKLIAWDPSTKQAVIKEE